MNPVMLGQQPENTLILGDDENLAQLRSASGMHDTLSDLAQLNDKVDQAAKANKKMQCLGSLMQMDLKDDMFLVGDIFMRKFYTVFDRDNDRVGLAPAIHTK